GLPLARLEKDKLLNKTKERMMCRVRTKIRSDAFGPQAVLEYLLLQERGVSCPRPIPQELSISVSQTRARRKAIVSLSRSTIAWAMRMLMKSLLLKIPLWMPIPAPAWTDRNGCF